MKLDIWWSSWISRDSNHHVRKRKISDFQYARISDDFLSLHFSSFFKFIFVLMTCHLKNLSAKDRTSIKVCSRQSCDDHFKSLITCGRSDKLYLDVTLIKEISIVDKITSVYISEVTSWLLLYSHDVSKNMVVSKLFFKIYLDEFRRDIMVFSIMTVKEHEIW